MLSTGTTNSSNAFKLFLGLNPLSIRWDWFIHPRKMRLTILLINTQIEDRALLDEVDRTLNSQHMYQEPKCLVTQLCKTPEEPN